MFEDILIKLLTFFINNKKESGLKLHIVRITLILMYFLRFLWFNTAF
jgi:hypothetical protein